MAKKRGVKKPSGDVQRLVAVQWEDIWSHDGWTSDLDTEEIAGQKMQFVTVGFLLEDTPEAIVLACTKGLLGNNSGKNTNGIWRIPRGVVKKVAAMGKLAL